MNRSCLAVDDEHLALNIVEKYVSRVPWLTFAGRCTTALQALERLRAEPVDILLLDIHLPDITGIDMLRSLPNAPLVIFTTAYSTYAVESYALDAVDYLLKPFSFERFLSAVQKAERALLRGPDAGALRADTTRVHGLGESIFIRTDKGDVRIAADDVRCITGLREFVMIRTQTREYMARENLRTVEARLAPFGFLRVHKSHIVNMRHVAVIDHTVLRVGDQVIPIGKTYRQAVRDYIAHLSIG